jgi:photosystem II stability/assembly factor-like uncharacterized protein
MQLFLVTTLWVVLGDLPVSGQWQQQMIGATADFRGLCVVSARVAWVGGTNGTYGRTTDAGSTWSVGAVAGAERLDFRDVEAFDETTAYLLSAGSGEDSRIYKTMDGGKSWSLQFKNSNPDAFFDAMAFWDEQNGIALSDPVNGRFQLISTDDGGSSWKPLQPNRLPQALPNEAAFAASGSCLVTHGASDVWFCTGGANSARIFRSSNRGQDWTVSDTPIMAGTASAGAFSIAFRDRSRGIIVGGDYRQPNQVGANAAITVDGGKTWTVIDKPFPYRSCVAWSGGPMVRSGHHGLGLFGRIGHEVEAHRPRELQQCELHSHR